MTDTHREPSAAPSSRTSTDATASSSLVSTSALEIHLDVDGTHVDEHRAARHGDAADAELAGRSPGVAGAAVLRASAPASAHHAARSLSLWHGCPLHAVLDADAEDVRHHPQKWAVLLGDAPELAVRVEWVSVPKARAGRDRFLGKLGSFRGAESLVAFAATGVRR